MRRVLVPALLVCALAGAGGAEAAEQLQLEVSGSRRTEETDYAKDGWGAEGGVALGNALAIVLAAGFEHYPGGAPAQEFPSFGGQVLRREGGGQWTVLTATGGLRLTVPARTFAVFVDGALGLASVAGRSPRFVDVATGAVVTPEYRDGWNGVVGEVGLGVRTNRSGSYDGYLALRSRSYSQLFEGPSGGSIQIRLGVMTR